jgi:Lsr2
MAQQVSIQYVDDLDGSAASGPVDFSLDGKGYTIDLSDTNASKLREILTPFVTAGRRAGGSARRSSASPARSGGPSRSRDEVQAMRGWLRDNGYTVKDRGRVPRELIAAYETRTPAVAATDRSAARKSRKGRKVNNVEFSGDGTK